MIRTTVDGYEICMTALRNVKVLGSNVCTTYKDDPIRTVNNQNVNPSLRAKLETFLKSALN